MVSKRLFPLFLVATLVAGNASFIAKAHAQQAPGATGPDFDPVTRTFSSKNPPLPDPNAPPGTAAPLTPEQQAELDRQKQLAEIQQRKEEAKKKAEEAHKAQLEKQAAAKAADAKRMAALKQAREERVETMKKNRAELKDLLQEQKDARKAYEEAKSQATGDTSQITEDYHKAEKDRELKIQELRHPKYKPMKFNADGTPVTAGTSTALPGTTTSGTGPTATTH